MVLRFRMDQEGQGLGGRCSRSAGRNYSQAVRRLGGSPLADSSCQTGLIEMI